MRKQLSVLVPFLGLIAAACGGSDTPAPQAPTTPAETAEPAATTPAEPEATKPAEPAPPPAPEPPKAPTPALTVKDAFDAPESVIYDDQADVYLVSNVGGDPGKADGNGYISRVSPEGQVVEAKWIDGTKKGTKLNAPKGLALLGDLLYVADIDTVRLFDRKTGKAKGEVKLKGATFANDIAAGSDGKVYVTDSGMKITEKGVEATKSDAVWVIEKKKAKALAKGEELGHPNGVVATPTGVWVVSFGSGELYQLDAKGVRSAVQKLPTGALDGIVVAGDKVLISSWEGKGVYVGTPGGEFELVFQDIASPADIGFDTKRNRLLVPNMGSNEVAIFDVK